MKNNPKQMPEIEQIPKTGQERPIPPDYVPEPKKQEDMGEKQEEEETTEEQKTKN
jgi:hypothetical protein